MVPFLSFLIVLHIVDYSLSLVWGFLLFLFTLHGRLQILNSVGLAQACPNYFLITVNDPSI